MKKIITTLLFLTNTLTSSSQGSVQDEFVYAKPSVHISGLSQKESEFVYWVNLFRSNPKGFVKYVDSFIKQFPQFNSPEYLSLVSELNLAKPMPTLELSRPMTIMAIEHGEYVVSTGLMDHVVYGEDLVARITKRGIMSAGENLYSGPDDPLMALILLLIDYGVPGLGHRINLFDKRWTKVGVNVTTNGSVAIYCQVLGV